jgi:DNA-binding transcriptional LysR family regulator
MSLVSRHLATTDFHICAAPGYLAEHGTPMHPSELADHPYLAFRTEHSSEEVTFHAADGTSIAVQPKTSFVCNNIGMLRASALAGMGIATLSAYLVEDDIRTGRLQRILPEYHLADREFQIVYSTRKFQSLKVKAFIDLAVEHFRQTNE